MPVHTFSNGRHSWKSFWVHLPPHASNVAAAATVPRGNTNAPTIAIAERAADLIKDNTPLAYIAPKQEPAGSNVSTRADQDRS